MAKVIKMKTTNRFKVKVALTLGMIALCPVLMIWFPWYWSMTPIAVMALMYFVGIEWRAVVFASILTGLAFMLHVWFNWWIAAGVPGLIAVFVLMQAYRFMKANNAAYDKREKFLASQAPKTFSERINVQGQLHNIMNHPANKEVFTDEDKKGIR